MTDLEVIKEYMSVLQYEKGNISVAELEDELYENQAGKIIQIDGWINLVPINGEVKQDTILGEVKHKTTLWDVELEHYNPGVYRYPDGSGEPPSVDVVEHKQGLTILEAVKEVWGLIVDNCMQLANDSLLAKEWEEDQICS